MVEPGIKFEGKKTGNKFISLGRSKQSVVIILEQKGMLLAYVL